MKIKDIVNRNLVNLVNCEHEPIHIPGTIQPHGFLIAFKTDTLVIDFCSDNVFDFTGFKKEELLSKGMNEVFGLEQTEQIHRYVRHLKNSPEPQTLSIGNKAFSASVHESDNIIIVEFEVLSVEAVGLSVFYNQTRQFVSYMEKSNSLRLLCQGIVDETRKITGYDRVMIYRFDKDYNGEVFAESKLDSIEPFLGLHYPHTDIPAQARLLYQQNLLRLIVDVNYKPVPIFTNDDGSVKNLDLSNSILRSVSPIHVQYLHNIGVGATLTISLMHQNKLWGLIACHHYTPKYINSFLRIAAQLQGHFLTSQINVRQVAEQHELSIRVNTSLDKMLGFTASLSNKAVDEIVKQEELLKLCNATGVIVFIGNEVYVNGRAPAFDGIRKLQDLLSRNMPDVMHTSRIREVFPDAEELADTAAGFLFHRFGPKSDMAILWLRSETLLEVKWAGDPNKAIIKDEKGLSPRKSFELWKETIRFQSNEWQVPELFAASNFVQAFERQMQLLFLIDEENKYRLLSEQLKETNAELENINWIGTHDLKEPLRKIQLFASRLLERQGGELSTDVVNSITRMGASARRMQTLIADILSYSKLLHTNDSLEKIDLNESLKNVLTDLGDDIEEVNGIVRSTELPTVDGNGFLLQQLLVNLLGNSIKFRKADRNLIIEISTSVVSRNTHGNDLPYHEIVIRDNGIGFEQEYSEMIFNVFTRLHSHSDYNGSGIGLSLCKKIMQNHLGFISAKGQPSIGTEIHLLFPVPIS